MPIEQSSLDTLFASPDLWKTESLVFAERRHIARRARQTCNTVEALEDRIVQSTNPVMGPEQPLDQQIASIDTQITAATTAEGSATNALAIAQQNLTSTLLACDQQIKTAEETVRIKQTDVDTANAAVNATDAQITDLQLHPEKAAGSFGVNWLSGNTGYATVPNSLGKSSGAVTISSNGLFLARGDNSGRTELIDTKTGTILATINSPGYIVDLAFDPTGGRLAALDSRGNLKIIDTATRTVTNRTITQDTYFGTMQWSGNEILVAMQCIQTIRAINVQTGAIRAFSSVGMTNAIAMVGTDAIFTAGDSGPVALYSTSGTLLAQAPSAGLALSVAASKDGSLMAALTWDGKLKIYNRSLQVVGSAEGMGRGYRVSFLPNNKGIVAYDGNGRFLIFDLATMQNGSLGTPTVIPTNDLQGYSTTMTASPDGSMIFNIDPNNGIRATLLPVALRTSSADGEITKLQTQRLPLKQQLDAATLALGEAQTALLTARQNQTTREGELTAIVNDCTKKLTHVRTLLADLRTQRQALQQELDALDDVFIDMSQDDASEQLAAELALSVQETLDAEENRIGYAKMNVSFQSSGQNTIFTIRYRNPGTRTQMDIAIDNNDGSFDRRGGVVAESPVRDDVWSFTLGMRANASGQGISFRMRNADTGEILAEVQGSYYPGNNSVALSTLQTDFATDEAGMLEENPITPGLRVAKIQGTTLLLAVQTPYDQFSIYSEMGGLLSSAEGVCAGGTTLGLCQITVNTNRATGDYPIRLYDRRSGKVLDTVMVHFNKQTNTLSLIDAADQYTGSSIDTTDIAQNLVAMQALQTIPLVVGDPAIARIQQLNMYYDTAKLPAPYNLYIDTDKMLQLLFATPEYVQFAEANIQDTIQKKWDAMGTYDDHGTLRHSYSYSVAEDAIMRGRRQIVQEHKDKLAVYEQGMAECMQAAVTMFVGIMQGKDEYSLRQVLDLTYQKWSQNGTIQSLAGISISFPSLGTIIPAAKMVFQEQWQYLVQVQADVAQVREREEFLLGQGQLKDALGNWHAATNQSSPVKPPSTMSAADIRLASKILSVIAASSDPRVRAINAMRQQEAALRVACITTSEPAQRLKEETAVLIDITKASAADTYVATHQTDVQNALETAGISRDLSTSEISNVFRWVKQNPALLSRSGFDGFSWGSLIQAAGNLLEGVFTIDTAEAFTITTFESRGMVNLANGISVNADSAVGGLFINMSHMLFETDSFESQKNVALSIQKVTAIPWFKIIGCIYNGIYQRTKDDALQALANLFSDAQYADIFSVSNAGSSILTSATNKDINHSYTFADEKIRIRFDYQTPNRSFDHVGIYLTNENGDQILESPVVYSTKRNYFIDIPMSDILSTLKSVWQKNNPTQPWQEGVWLHGNFKFKVAIWESNVAGSPALSGSHVLTNAFSISNTGNPFGEDVPLSNKLTGTSFGVDWDDRNITDSCVLTARAIVNNFGTFYKGAKIPTIIQSPYQSPAAARLMSTVDPTFDNKGNVVMNPEIDTPGFTKVYLNQIPEGTLPPVGAVIVWNINMPGHMGHVAVVVSNKNGSIEVIDGNWIYEEKIVNDVQVRNGFGSVHTLPNFENVIGWLIPNTSF